jgi:hygromycin-B 4-O-kinase
MVLNPARVEAFLIDRFGTEIAEVTPIDHGEWSKAFLFRRGQRGYVVRFSALQEDFLKDRRAMGYASADLPMPRIVDVGEAFDGFYAISEQARGNFIDSLDGTAFRRLLPSLFAALDAARQVDLATTTGYGVWRADGTGPHPTWRDALLDVATDVPTKRTFGWRERLAASPTGSGPFDAAFGCLQLLVDACPAERHLVHSDLLNYNVLCSGDRITAVIDWGSSMYGDFVFDVAWLSFWQPWYPAWGEINFAGEAARHYASIGLDVPRFDERLRCYEVFIGLEHLAYNAFKGRWPELEAVAERTLKIATGH